MTILYKNASRHRGESAFRGIICRDQGVFMTAAYVSLAIVGFMVFLFAQPKVKALISFFLMMQLFNIGPSELFGMYVWDYGAILMLITAGEISLRRPAAEPENHGYIVALRIFLGWLLICFLWSLLIYQYPAMHTIKNARSMIVGYSMTLIFIRLFSVQPDSFAFLMKWLYRLTFVLMPVFVLQYVLKRPLLFAPVNDYEGALRAIPVFWPFCLLNFWIILVKFLSSERLAIHEALYAVLALVTVALTYTRGIYLGTLFTTGVLAWTMSRDHKLRASSAFGAGVAVMILIAALLVSGVAQKVAGRAASGLQLLSSSESTTRDAKNDTFNGRLGLAAERFSLAWAQNPLVGYGFIHEEDVSSDLRSSLKYGTPLGGTAADPTAFSRYDSDGHYTLGFYTADIAWADIVISTGCVGALLLVAVILSVVFGHYRDRDGIHPMGYGVRLALFLQFVMTFLLMFDGDSFYGNVHIPAFFLAGYSLTRGRRQRVVASAASAIERRPANLLT
jgi:hypothetical protein